MEPWFVIAIIVVVVAILIALVATAYEIGKLQGRVEEYEATQNNKILDYPTTSPPTQQSGTHTPERGSDDTE